MRTRSVKHIALLQVTIASIFLPAWLHAQSPAGLSIRTGSSLVTNGPVFFVLNNMGFTNDGNFVADSSNVIFTGSPGTMVAIGGGTTSSFNRLTLNNTVQGTVRLNQSITVTGDLGMQGGVLLLNGHEVTLAGNGRIMGESNQSFIYDNIPASGSVIVTRKLFKPQAVNPGNIGIEITSNANLGSTTIVRRFDEQSSMTGGTGIARWFSITPANNIGLNISVRIHYLDHELRSTPAAFLDVWKGSDIMAAWFDAGRSSWDTAQRWVQLDGIDHFNRLTLGSIDNDPILPVTQRQSSMGAKTAAGISPVNTLAYPNPSRNQVMLRIASSREQDLPISVYDQAAHLLQRKMVHLQMGSNTLSWDLSAYPAGIYYLVPESRECTKFKIVKQ